MDARLFPVYSARMPRWRPIFLMLSLLPVLLRPVRASDMDKIRELTREKFPGVKHLSTEALANWLIDTNRAPPLLVDVRSGDEFRVSHLRNALHTTSVEEVNKRANSPARAVVVYCAVGYRSAAFAQKLQKAGLTNVFNLDGSIFQWANEGREVVRGTAPVKEVHPYDRKWGELLKPEYRSKAR
jgi:rhodanese-related sulfurtransferase